MLLSLPCSYPEPPGQSPYCDVESGQCECKDGMRGLRCTEVMAQHYTPLLHQFKYEIEVSQTNMINFL